MRTATAPATLFAAVNERIRQFVWGGFTYATIAPNASPGFRRMTSLKLVFLITYQARLASDLIPCHIMLLREGDAGLDCPPCFDEFSGSLLGGAVDFIRYIWFDCSIMETDGKCCRGRLGRVLDGKGNRCERRKTPADRSPAAVDIGIVLNQEVRAQLVRSIGLWLNCNVNDSCSNFRHVLLGSEASSWPHQNFHPIKMFGRLF